MAAPLAIIPSRFAAQRFPGKPLALIAGKPMVQHVYERCLEARCFGQVVIATDDERITASARSFGATVALTSPTCASGTDRVAEAARALGARGDDVVVNVQGDEPAVHPEALFALVSLFSDERVQMGTLVRALDDAERGNPNVVKAVLGEQGDAIYFSRADIPHQRGSGANVQRWAHLGLYGYRAATLQQLAALQPTALERAESLEQLRALGHGIAIRCGVTKHRSTAVDRPEDVPLAEAALRALLR